MYLPQHKFTYLLLHAILTYCTTGKTQLPVRNVFEYSSNHALSCVGICQLNDACPIYLVQDEQGITPACTGTTFGNLRVTNTQPTHIELEDHHKHIIYLPGITPD